VNMARGWRARCGGKLPERLLVALLLASAAAVPAQPEPQQSHPWPDSCTFDLSAEDAGGRVQLPALPVADSPGGERSWRITNESAGGKTRALCGVGVIEAPLDDVRRVILDADAYDEYMPRMLVSDVEPVSGTGPGDLVYLNHQVLAAPFPVEDRHFTIRVETSVALQGRAWRAKWTYVEGSGNIRLSTGSWTLVDVPERNGTALIYRVLTDPGGRVPDWVVRRTATNTLRKVLRAVRVRVHSLRQ